MPRSYWGSAKPTTMYKTIFLKAGLSPTQADILDYLYENKEEKASVIAKKIKKSRAIVYKDLDELVKLELVEAINKPDAVSYFRIAHPTHIEKFFDKRENEVKKDRQLFNNYLPDMVSSFNLIHSKPGVKYYEGTDGVIRVLENITGKLKPGTEIISFTKVLPGEFQKDLNEAIDNFIKKRIKKTVKTRVIAVDAPEVRKMTETDAENLRETRITKSDKLPLDFPGGEMFIYGDEIFITTTANDNHFAFSIYNNNVAAMLRAFFEALWALLPSSY